VVENKVVVDFMEVVAEVEEVEVVVES